MLLEDFSFSQRKFIQAVSRSDIWPSKLLHSVYIDKSTPKPFWDTEIPQFNDAITIRIIHLLRYASQTGGVDGGCAEAVVNILAFENMFPLDMGEKKDQAHTLLSKWNHRATRPEAAIASWFKGTSPMFSAWLKFKDRAPVILCKMPANDLLKMGYADPEDIARTLRNRSFPLQEFRPEAIQCAHEFARQVSDTQDSPADGELLDAVAKVISKRRATVEPPRFRAPRRQSARAVAMV